MIRLTNFCAKIICDILCDDGVEIVRLVEVTATINGRSQTFTVTVPQFSQMNWPLEQLGPEAIVQPGQTTRERARAAVRFSPAAYHSGASSHTGWCQVAGAHVYLHAGGALGAVGPVPGVEVRLPNALTPYLLPEHGTELREAVRSSLGLYKIAPGRITVPLLGAIYRAVLGGTDFSVHLSGHTGVFKSELAALAQQHYGPTLNARNLPCSWSSTANALEATAFAAKDVLLVIDDFVPQGTVADRARLNAQADRVMRPRAIVAAVVVCNPTPDCVRHGRRAG